MAKDPAGLAVTVVVLALGAAVGWAGSQGGAVIGGLPVVALLVGLAFLAQFVAFVPSFIFQTERFYDLTGSVTYILLTSLAAWWATPMDTRSALLSALVVVWAARLGRFLYRRVREAGTDARFDELKPSFVRFLNVWVIQGLWVTLTAGAAWTAITSTQRTPVNVLTIAGALTWLAGFTIEVVADRQKALFRAADTNRGRFIHTGLWSWSRHPNYFGEIVLWAGIALIALPALSGWQLVTLISPLFVFVLITRISGIPLLERRADERWGGQPDYETYKARTPVLVPLPPKR